MHRRLALAAAVALLASSCDPSPQPTVSQPSTSTNTTTAQNGEETPAVFYKTTEECEADVEKQVAEYAVLESAFEAGTLETAPTAPPLKQEDCEPQMQAAQAAHQQSAPTYNSLAECQEAGLECEPANTGYYRPRFGGSYFYPYGGSPNFIFLNYGGSQRRLYQPSPVYQSSTPGSVVTPSGQVITNRGTGRVNAPRSVTTASPSRPQGTPAKGAVTGRGSQGFGSTYKGTGRGGK